MKDSIDDNNALTFISNVHKHNIKNDSDFLLANILIKDSLSILDVGYGTGNLLLKIKSQTYKTDVYGVEKSKTLYEYSKEKLLKEKINIFYTDFWEWSVDKQFDIIIMSFYLHHVNDFAKHLEKAIPMLNHNGKIVILDRIAKDDAAKKEFYFYWEEYYSSKHEWDEECPHIFSRQELIDTLKNRDFDIGEFILVPNDSRQGTENFPKTLVVIKSQ